MVLKIIVGLFLIISGSLYAQQAPGDIAIYDYEYEKEGKILFSGTAEHKIYAESQNTFRVVVTLFDKKGNKVDSSEGSIEISDIRDFERTVGICPFEIGAQTRQLATQNGVFKVCHLPRQDTRDGESVDQYISQSPLGVIVKNITYHKNYATTTLLLKKLIIK